MSLEHVTSTLKDSFQRGANYYREGVLEADIWFEIASKDYIEFIKAFDFNKLFCSFSRHIELLDVGCGVGRFPSMLRGHLQQNIRIFYDYLDPSDYCLSETRKNLLHPYIPRDTFHTTVENLQLDKRLSNGYDIVWCIHSLYYVNRNNTVMVIDKLKKLVDPTNGTVVIFIASYKSFYNQLYDFYNSEFYTHTKYSFVTAEDLVQAMELLGIGYEVKKLHFYHTIPCNERHILEKYLQHCVLDPRPLNKWLMKPYVSAFLDSFRDGAAYHFPQSVWLLTFKS